MKKILILALLVIVFSVYAFGQSQVIPYPHTIPGMYLPPSPVGGIAGGLIYGISQAPIHSYPDYRTWEESDSFRRVIRSWELMIFSRSNDKYPMALVSGFCSVPSALTHARRIYPGRYSMTMPSPLPCWRADGEGVR